jgi:hypothetical protein
MEQEEENRYVIDGLRSASVDVPMSFENLVTALDLIDPRLLPRHTSGYLWYQRELARFTYKPGWKFQVFSYAPERPLVGAMCTLMIKLRVPDTYHPENIIDVQSVHGLYAGVHDASEEAFARYLAECIAYVELHEAREWLRRDGEIYDNPHA